jgi:hypothetical protein
MVNTITPGVHRVAFLRPDGTPIDIGEGYVLHFAEDREFSGPIMPSGWAASVWQVDLKGKLTDEGRRFFRQMLGCKFPIPYKANKHRYGR